MRVAIVTFDGFDELDSFVALGLLNRMRADGWSAHITSPSAQVTSMNGVTVAAQQPLEFANEADAVIFGCGLYARAIASNSAPLDRLQLDPLRQLIAGLGSGTLLMARLGLLGTMPACTDPSTKRWLMEAGVLVLDEPFHARGPVATAAGNMAAQYLAAWILARRIGVEAAQKVLQQVAPVTEEHAYAARVMAVVKPFLEEPAGGRPLL